MLSIIFFSNDFAIEILILSSNFSNALIIDFPAFPSRKALNILFCSEADSSLYFCMADLISFVLKCSFK